MIELRVLNRELEYIGNVAKLTSAVRYQSINEYDYLQFTYVKPPIRDLEYLEVEKNYTIYYREVRGNNISYPHFTVTEVTETHTGAGIEVSVTAKSWLELLDSVFIEDKRPTNTTAFQALVTALGDAIRFEPKADDLGLNSTTFYRISALEAVKKVASTWGGEIDVRYRGTYKTQPILYLTEKMGIETNLRFTYRKNIAAVTRKILSDKIVTALYGFGKGEATGDGYGRRLDFASINNGKMYLTNEEARETWGLIPSAIESTTKKHSFDQVIFDDVEDKAELKALTQQVLDRVSQPQVLYELNSQYLYPSTDKTTPAFNNLLSNSEFPKDDGYTTFTGSKSIWLEHPTLSQASGRNLAIFKEDYVESPQGSEVTTALQDYISISFYDSQQQQVERYNRIRIDLSNEEFTDTEGKIFVLGVSIEEATDLTDFTPISNLYINVTSQLPNGMRNTSSTVTMEVGNPVSLMLDFVAGEKLEYISISSAKGDGYGYGMSLGKVHVMQTPYFAPIDVHYQPAPEFLVNEYQSFSSNALYMSPDGYPRRHVMKLENPLEANKNYRIEVRGGQAYTEHMAFWYGDYFIGFRKADKNYLEFNLPEYAADGTTKDIIAIYMFDEYIASVNGNTEGLPSHFSLTEGLEAVEWTPAPSEADDYVRSQTLVSLGDTVTVIDTDFEPELRDKFRVLRLETDLLNPLLTRMTLGETEVALTDTITTQSGQIVTLKENHLSNLYQIEKLKDDVASLLAENEYSGYVTVNQSVVSGNVRYYKRNGIVTLAISHSSLAEQLAAYGTAAIFTLPVGFRPPTELWGALTFDQGAHAAVLRVNSSAVVSIHSRQNTIIPTNTAFRGILTFPAIE